LVSTSENKDPFDKKTTKEILQLMSQTIDTLEEALQLTKLVNPKDAERMSVSIETILGILRILIKDQQKMIQTLMVLMVERDNNSKMFCGIATDIEKFREQVDKLWSAVNK
jgi:hypothetical protein